MFTQISVDVIFEILLLWKSIFFFLRTHILPSFTRIDQLVISLLALFETKQNKKSIILNRFKNHLKLSSLYFSILEISRYHSFCPPKISNLCFLSCPKSTTPISVFDNRNWYDNYFVFPSGQILLYCAFQNEVWVFFFEILRVEHILMPVAKIMQKYL